MLDETQLRTIRNYAADKRSDAVEGTLAKMCLNLLADLDGTKAQVEEMESRFRRNKEHVERMMMQNAWVKVGTTPAGAPICVQVGFGVKSKYRLHVLTDRCTLEHLMVFSSRSMCAFYGYSGNGSVTFEEARNEVEASPSVFLGDSSGNNADVLGKRHLHVPATIDALADVFDRVPQKANGAMIRKVREAYRLPNEAVGRELGDVEAACRFLTENRGKPVFWINW